MDDKSLVSIIVPVYNVQQYIRMCLDSLIFQTYPHLDIILIDDGSTDDSGKICDEYAAQDKRVRVIHQKNMGAANAKNTGLDLAQGDYITFMDSDDWAEPEWVERMVQATKTNHADVVECSFLMEYTSSAKSAKTPTELSPESDSTIDYLRIYPQIWTCALFWNKLFKASLISGIRFHKERRCIDDEFFTYKVISGANKIVRIPDELYHYRQRRSSVTQTDKTLYQRTIDDIDLLAERHSWIKKHCPALAMEYLRHDTSTLLYLAKYYPFDAAAISQFRKSAKYYFFECLHNYPGKVAMFYATKAFFYPGKKFPSKPQTSQNQADLSLYFP